MIKKGTEMANEAKKYWCVTSRYDGQGDGFSGITDTRVADKKPESTFHSTIRFDIYNDWFDSYEEAEKFARSQKRGKRNAEI